MCAFAATASAATLQPTGQVWVNKGSGPQPVKGATHVNPGDVVTVGPGASARIVYPNGCSMPVSSGMQMTVTLESQCIAAPGESSSFIGLAGAAAIGATLIYIAVDDRSASP